MDRAIDPQADSNRETNPNPNLIVGSLPEVSQKLEQAEIKDEVTAEQLEADPSPLTSLSAVRDPDLFQDINRDIEKIQDSPRSDGFAAYFEARPDNLMGVHIDEVVFATDLVYERDAKNELKAFQVESLFHGKDEVFLGFGNPNVYTVAPGTDGVYKEFAGKSLWRAPTAIKSLESGWIQSGVQIRFKFPKEEIRKEATESIREAMKKFEGEKYITCVNANGTMLEEAGFTLGDKPLGKRVWPVSMLKAFNSEQLYFKEIPVEIEVIKTTSQELESYGRDIHKSERNFLWRHLKRGSKFLSNKFKKKTSPWKQKVVAPELPEDENQVKDLSVQVSQASYLGRKIRKYYQGQHTIFEADIPKGMTDKFFTKVLKPFPVEQPSPENPNPEPQSLMTRIKKRYLFNTLEIKAIASVLCPRFKKVSGDKTEKDVHRMLRTHTPEQFNKYNVVITDDRVIVSRVKTNLITKGFAKAADWILCKHVLLSRYDKTVRFAGEMWKDAEGQIHVSGNSGTYKPGEREVDQAVNFLSNMFRGMGEAGRIQKAPIDAL